MTTEKDDHGKSQAARAVSWIRRQQAPFTAGPVQGYVYCVEEG